MYQEDRYAGIRTVHPNRLKPRGIFILCLIGILLFFLALYHIPWPERVELEMYGAEVDAQGNELATGIMVIEGWRYHYLFQDDRLQLTHLELPNFEAGDPWDTGTAPYFYPVKYQPDDLRMTHSVLWVSDALDDFVSFWVYTTEEYGHFVFYSAASGRIFIGTAIDNPDYAGILDWCGLLEE